jgi:hypothetical protein
MSGVFSKFFIKLSAIIFLSFCSHALHAQEKPRVGSSELGEANIPKFSCQWSERTPDKDWGCTGMIGLMRLSRRVTTANDPGNRKKASLVLFGAEELPVVGAEVKIKRSAHLRHDYWPERDDQEVSRQQKICTGIGCMDNWQSKECGSTVGEFSHEMLRMKGRMNLPPPKVKRSCPGPTDFTDYLAAGTVVKILGYQQMGAFFVLVQVIKIESIFPIDDEKKYDFDHNEII